MKARVRLRMQLPNRWASPISLFLIDLLCPASGASLSISISASDDATALSVVTTRTSIPPCRNRVRNAANDEGAGKAKDTYGKDNKRVQ